MAAEFDRNAEKKAIEQTVRNLCQTVNDSDMTTFRSLIWPQGRVIRSRDGQVSYFDFDTFADKVETDIKSSPGKLTETIHDETFKILSAQPDFAVVWFASTLLAADRPVTYIVNAMSLVKREGTWKFTFLADTGISLQPDQPQPHLVLADFKHDDDEKEIRKVVTKFFDNLANLNVENMLSTIWTPDAGAAISRLDMPPPNPDVIFLRFSNLITDFVAPTIDPGNPLWEAFDDYVVLVHNDLAVATGRFGVYQKEEGNPVLKSHGYNSFMLLKKDGVWKFSAIADTSRHAHIPIP